MNVRGRNFISLLLFCVYFLNIYTLAVKRNWIIFDYSNAKLNELKTNAISNNIEEEEDAEDPPLEFIAQVPLDYTPPKVLRNITDSCRFNQDCHSGCCLYNRGTSKRTCEPKSKTGERCSVGQIKVNHYADFCPCENGDDACPHPTYICI